MTRDEVLDIVAKASAAEEQADLTRANLRWVDLRDVSFAGADMTSTELAFADLRNADLTCAKLHNANLRGANLTGANLRWVDLFDADLRGADLTGANIDYAAWPLWCGSIGVKTDDRQSKQQGYHWLVNNISHLRAAGFTTPELQKLADYVNGFHRVVSLEVKPIVVTEARNE